MSEPPQRYYCHHCNATCIPVAPDFVCPTCNEGFIEPMRVSPLSQPPPGMFPVFPEEHMGERNHAAMVRQMMEQMMRQYHTHNVAHAPGESAPTDSSSSSHQPSTPSPNGDTPNRSAGHSHRIHSSSISPNSSGMAHPGGTGRLRFVLGEGLHQHDANGDALPTLLNMIMQGFGVGGTSQMVGNPGDYAWGPTGLDNIISQLIGQLDGSGPPPAQQDTIDSLPDVTVPQKHIDNKLDCTVCQEYFTAEEKVKELPCSHYFHVDCIVPWLKLHNSCPICRVSIDGEEEEDVAMPDDTDGMPELEEPSAQVAAESSSASGGPLHEDDLD